MSGVPDYPLESTIDFKFTSRSFSTGVPTTLGGTPAVEIYEDNSITQITTAETLTVDFDSITGLNNLRVVATAANGFEAGKSYAAVISAGTVGGVSVVGEVVAQFSIQRSPVNWANVTAPTTAVDLAGTNIQLVDTTTTNTDMRGTDNAALATALTTAQNDLDTLTGTDGVTLATSQPNYAPSTHAALDVWHVATSSIVTASTIGLQLKTNVDAVLTDRTLAAAAYFDPATDTVANVTTVATTTTNTDMRGTDNAALATALATAQTDLDTITGTDGVTLATAQANYAPATAAALATVDTNVDAILVDTGTTIPATIATAQTDLDTLTGTDGATLATSQPNFTPATAADVNAQVLDVLNVDTFAEPSAVPAATSTLVDKLSWMFTVSRNKMTQTATTSTLRNDADGANIATATVSDDGTTFTRQKYA